MSCFEDYEESHILAQINPKALEMGKVSLVEHVDLRSGRDLPNIALLLRQNKKELCLLQRKESCTNEQKYERKLQCKI